MKAGSCIEKLSFSMLLSIRYLYMTLKPTAFMRIEPQRAKTPLLTTLPFPETA
jgi:hypothetical protein